MATQRILVVSDIHSNLPALEAVLKDAEEYGPYGMKLCAGDMVGYGPFPNEVLSIIEEHGFKCVLGNHDIAVMKRNYNYFHTDAAAACRINRRALNRKGKRFLRRFSMRPLLDDRLRYAMVHGSFIGNEEANTGHAYHEIYILERYGAADAMKHMVFAYEGNILHHVPLGIVGHTHIPMLAISYMREMDKEGNNGMVIEECNEISLGENGTIIRIESISGKPEDDEQALDGLVDQSAGEGSLAGKQDYEKRSIWHKKMLFNPGSVGQPRNGSPQAHYGIITFEDDINVTLEWRKVAYDQSRIIDKMIEKRYPRSLIDRLPFGR